MDRTGLTLIAATALLVAVVLGWALRWIYGLFNPPPTPEAPADSEWAEYAKACEAERDAAVARLTEVEAQLSGQLSEARAERDAAMDGLGDARRAAEALQQELDGLRKSG
ncbi:MAG: hypothetical protein AAGE76_05470 [Pseudomonadota bacterium]